MSEFPSRHASPSLRMYLVQLQDEDEIFLVLVRPEVYEWIHQPYSPPPDMHFCYDEKVPENICSEYFKCNKMTTCTVTENAFANDRALNAPGRTFDSVIDVVEYVIGQHIQLAGEYHGHLY